MQLQWHITPQIRIIMQQGYLLIVFKIFIPIKTIFQITLM